MRRTLYLISFVILFISQAHAQPKSILYGVVKDSLGNPIDLANIAVTSSREGTMSKVDGTYELELPPEKDLQLVISCIGYHPFRIKVALYPGETRELNFILAQDVTALEAVSVSVRREQGSTFQNINVKNVDYMPSTAGRIESLIKSQAGVSSNNELSSQYSVRGGNFDENLVYVNDVEIYRPFLVRSGQQEGLSFINSDLVSSIRFSAGGFDARYGDKMSSALDITYKEPTEFAGSVSASMLGASLHFEGASADNKFTYLAGYRYKTTSYLLNTLDVSGDYNPQFSDFQTLLSYDLSPRLEISFLGNYSSNSYQLIPATQVTEFGTTKLPFDLRIYYDGQEIDKFETYLGATTLHYKPSANLSLKFIGTIFRTAEQETFDIFGEYYVNQLDNTVGSETFGDSILNVAAAGQFVHARNYLDAYVYAAAHVGSYVYGQHNVKWGLKYQYQVFYDNINEWEYTDSAGYIKNNTESEIILDRVSIAQNEISYDLLNAFIQDTWEFSTLNANYYLTMGTRASIWNFNKKFYFSPRTTFSVQPNWQQDVMFNLSAGFYFQPPFYKEMRMPNDEINYEIQPQRSIHLLLGGDYIFDAWGRPFKLTAEAYYKWLDQLIPYKIENIRLSYAGENLASGYAKGIDLKINGEFVPGAESWFTASFMQTREDIPGDSSIFNVDGELLYLPAGEYPRPTDQLFTTGVYFQDYFPRNPDYKVQLSAFFGSGLPFTQPREDTYFTNFRMKAYKRVDLGFSKVLKREGQVLGDRNPLKHFTSVWVSAEIFNLLDIDNVASYTWIRTVANSEGITGSFNVPNYLTGRRFNVKIAAKF